MKRLIETKFPIRIVSAESAREKTIRLGHISTLHIYWARKPLSVSRTTALAALLPDNPAQRAKFLYLLEAIAPWKVGINPNATQRYLLQEVRHALYQVYSNAPPRVLDPFAGGGSIPLEALRLGCETHALDYNPIAVLLNIATLQYPRQFGNKLVYKVRRWGAWVLQEARRELQRFYPEDPDGSIPVGYIWAFTIHCQNPTCGAEIPLLRHSWLSRKRKIALFLQPNPAAKRLDPKIVWQKDEPFPFDPERGIVDRGVVKCPLCSSVIDAKTFYQLAIRGKLGRRLMVVISSHPRHPGKFFRLPTDEDEKTFHAAEKALETKHQQLYTKWGINPIPDEPLPPSGKPGFHLQRMGVKVWGDFFNARQKLALITFADAIRRAHARMLEMKEDPELAKAVTTYLAIAFDRLVDYSSCCCVWKADSEGIAHTFRLQALPLTWDYCETNPISDSHGSWKTLLDGTLKTLTNLQQGLQDIQHGAAIVQHGTATQLPYPDNHFDAVLTDPPYYDYIFYADLSDFFYVWFKRILGDLYPNLFTDPLTPKSEQVVADPIRAGGRKQAKREFEQLLTQAFCEIRRVLKPEGIAVIVFAHKTTEAWETMLNALVTAGLIVTASWPIHTELTSRLRALRSVTISTSIYLVCRKRISDKVGYWNEVQEEILKNIHDWLGRTWNLGIQGPNFMMSAIGPVMEVIGQYGRVEDASGEPVTVKQIIKLVQETVSQYALYQILQNETYTGKLDPISCFYLLYRWSYKRAEVPFEEARELARNVGLELTTESNQLTLMEQRKGKVRLLAPHEREWNLGSTWETLFNQTKGSLIEVLQLASILWERDQKEELKNLLLQEGYVDRPLFWLLAQAIAEALPAGDKEKQLLHGLLSFRQNLITLG